MIKISVHSREGYNGFLLLIDGDVAVLSTDDNRQNMTVIRNLRENTTINVPCACDDCTSDELRNEINRLCIENGAKTLILGHKTYWHPIDRLKVIEAAHTSYPENKLPDQFEVVTAITS